MFFIALKSVEIMQKSSKKGLKMKTILKLTSVALSLSLFMSACSHKVLYHGDAKTAAYPHFSKKLTQKELYNIIMKVGKKNSWRMTEFKDNELIAEKSIDGETKALSIHFANDYFYTSPENKDLNDAIQNAIKK